jgi:predicted dinucleotide-binding enzyme
MVKALNNIYARHPVDLGKPAGAPRRIPLPVAGDVASKAVVIRLLDELRFDGVEAGGLDESWRQQPGTPVYATDFDVAGVKRAPSEATKERKPEWSATANSPGSFAQPA